MAPTSDERREVARRLRKVSAHRQGISCDAVDKALGIWYDDSYFGCVFAHESVLRLADLIDPTCERDENGFGSGRAYCMDCRCQLEPEYKYCPNCGARLVDEDAD